MRNRNQAILSKDLMIGGETGEEMKKQLKLNNGVSE